MRILQPERNPLLAQFQANILKIRPYFLLVLLKVTGLQIQLVYPRRELAVGYPQRFSVRLQSLELSIVLNIRRFILLCLPLVGLDLILKLGDLLARVGERVGFAVERFHAVATDATTLIEEVLAEIKRVGALRHPIVRMTHLAARLGVLFVIKRMQPERIKPVRLDDARRRPAIPVVASRATKLLRVMNL